MHFAETERTHFERIIQQDVRQLSPAELKTGGYVIEVLESGIYYFLQGDTYADSVLSIINLGHDTDTAAAIVGGLAGLYYGRGGIPEQWLVSLARLEDIETLGKRLNSR